MKTKTKIIVRRTLLVVGLVFYILQYLFRQYLVPLLIGAGACWITALLIQIKEVEEDEEEKQINKKQKNDRPK